MTIMDKATEEIAHFIGLLHMAIEESRLRDAYTDFFYHNHAAHVNSAPFVTTKFEAPFEFLGFDPDVDYRAPVYTTPLWHPSFQGHHSFPLIPTVEPHSIIVHSHLPEFDIPGFYMGHGSWVMTIEPVGSVANYMVQAASLSDDDYFSVGGSDHQFNPVTISDADVLSLAEEAFDLSPIHKPDIPGSNVEIIDTLNSIISQLEDLTAPVDDTPAQIFVAQSETLDGIYVNGELVDEAPKLKDYVSFGDEDDADAKDDTAGAETDDEDKGPPTNVVVSPDGTITPDNSVTVVAGDNTVVNEAVVKNLWTGATVTAVAGDHIEINAIIQTNVIQDHDTLAGTINSLIDNDGPNEVFNIASFQRTDPSADTSHANAPSGGFPSAWAVTTIQGDLTITNWLEQYVFMTDNDVGVLSASGATINVTAGSNTSVNHISILELARTYDLMIVGGSIYDANIIHQTNVLLDNDVVGTTSNFSTTGTGTVSTSGNLLWNQAQIYNIGAADRFSGLPDAYREAMDDLAGGGTHMPSGVLTDSAFAGLGGLRVLYISGDYVNVNYVKQTTIMGDSDQIELAMNAVHPNPGATWSISTGGNHLINTAGIIDLDSLGKTYVGGHQYSQETLYQAELISHRTDLHGLDPNTLTSEAVLFLDDTMLADNGPAAGAAMPLAHDGHYQHDGLNHVLG